MLFYIFILESFLFQKLMDMIHHILEKMKNIPISGAGERGEYIFYLLVTYLSDNLVMLISAILISSFSIPFIIIHTSRHLMIVLSLKNENIFL